MMFTETKKEILVEYSINVVYDSLMYIFPVKYYKISRYDYSTHCFRVIDSFNRGFEMNIFLQEHSLNTTKIVFIADYPHALFDLTHGGQQAIDMILEELLNELNRQPKTAIIEYNTTDIEVVDADNFVNTTKNKTHTLTIIVGYVLSALSISLPLISIINYNPDFIMFIIFYIGILCLSFEISLSVILQYYEDSKSIFHGRIQLCLCGISLIMLGIMIHPSLIIAGILIPVISIVYFLKREKSAK